MKVEHRSLSGHPKCQGCYFLLVSALRIAFAFLSRLLSSSVCRPVMAYAIASSVRDAAFVLPLVNCFKRAIPKSSLKWSLEASLSEECTTLAVCVLD